MFLQKITSFCVSVLIFKYTSPTIVLIIRRSKLYHTASSIITHCRWPSGAQVLSQPVHRTATYSV